ncbi:hypothetical protein RHSIM_Rhsim10G0039300 [Rhododendron simsii]|uniref:Uncharacterized protein n=1 Tax=Rhododendron simsii TaxID=118357 RepID=A0A834LDT6_RHOSS|nr:hypothetical protein RHSIM_Rhsim10G0039300 [Rhododendron simsii]
MDLMLVLEVSDKRGIWLEVVDCGEELATVMEVDVGIFQHRYKVGDMGVKQAEPRLERKKHRRQSRKTVNQSILEELDDLDDDDNLLYDSVLRALGHESQ